MTNENCVVCREELEEGRQKYCSTSCRKAREGHSTAYKRHGRKIIDETDDRLRSKLLYQLGKLDALVDELEERDANLPIVVEKTRKTEFDQNSGDSGAK